MLMILKYVSFLKKESSVFEKEAYICMSNEVQK